MAETKEADKQIPVVPTEPEGEKPSEGTVIGASLASEEKPVEKPDKTGSEQTSSPETKKDQKWDKEEQYKSEIRAAQIRESDLRDKVASSETEAERLKSQLEEIESKKAKGEGYDFEQFEDVAKALKNVMQDLDDFKKEFLSSKEETDGKLREVGTQSSEAQQTAKEGAGQRALDQACKPLDAKFGAQHRNDAISEINAKFKRLQIGHLPPQSQREWVLENLESTYVRLSAAYQTVKDDSLPAEPVLDSSQGGAPVRTQPVTIQEGTLDSVVEQYRQANSGPQGHR